MRVEVAQQMGQQDEACHPYAVAARATPPPAGELLRVFNARIVLCPLASPRQQTSADILLGEEYQDTIWFEQLLAEIV